MMELLGDLFERMLEKLFDVLLDHIRISGVEMTVDHITEYVIEHPTSLLAIAVYVCMGAPFIILSVLNVRRKKSASHRSTTKPPLNG